MKNLVKAYILNMQDKERQKQDKEGLQKLTNSVRIVTSGLRTSLEECYKEANEKIQDLSIRIDSKIGKTVLDKFITEINKKFYDLSIRIEAQNRELDSLKEKRFRVYKNSIQKEVNELLRPLVSKELNEQNEDFEYIKSSFRSLNLDFIRFEKEITSDISMLKQHLRLVK